MLSFFAGFMLGASVIAVISVTFWFWLQPPNALTALQVLKHWDRDDEELTLLCECPLGQIGEYIVMHVTGDLEITADTRGLLTGIRIVSRYLIEPNGNIIVWGSTP